MGKSDRWEKKVGPHGATVTVRERKRGGNVYLYAYDPELNGRRKTSLGFKVRNAEGKLMKKAMEEALAQAGDLSNRLLQGDLPISEPDAKVGRVLDLFREEEIHGLSDSHEAELRRGLEAWENFLGRSFDLRTVGVREWNAFKRQRSSGEIDARGKEVRAKKRKDVAPRTVAKDLKTLRQVCRFAERYREGDGFILDADPTRGLELPSEPNPRRPVADDETLQTLLGVADQIRVGHTEKPEKKVRAPLREMLILASHTGRRIGAIVRLRWSDWFPDEGTYGILRWRADSDKLGREWKAPVTPEVREALENLRCERPGVGEAYIFPAPESKGHVRVDVAGKWLRAAEEKAKGHTHKKGFGWHAFRRMWATKRKHLPAKDVAAAGGWKDTATLQRVYQHADPETMEAVVMGGRDLRMGPSGDDPEEQAAEASR